MVAGELKRANRGKGHSEGDRRVQAPQPMPLGPDRERCGGCDRGQKNTGDDLVWRGGQVCEAGQSRSARRGEVEDEHAAGDHGHCLSGGLKPAPQGQLREKAEARRDQDQDQGPDGQGQQHPGDRDEDCAGGQYAQRAEDQQDDADRLAGEPGSGRCRVGGSRQGHHRRRADGGLRLLTHWGLRLLTGGGVKLRRGGGPISPHPVNQ